MSPSIPLAPLAALLRQQGISQGALSRRVGISKSSMSRLASRGQWPGANPRRITELRARLVQELAADGIAPDAAQAALPAVEPDPQTPAPETAPQEEDTMLLQNAALTPAAKKAFGLARSPFVDDVQSREDVFQSPGIRLARAALMDAATNSGFVALVGESGAGKTTLVDELEERIGQEGREIVIIRPYTLSMDGKDAKGLTLKAAHIAEAIIGALDPNVGLKSSPQARFRQLHDLLKSSRRAGRRHLLLIDEAHCLPLPTLKHLKRFVELKDGLARLIGVALVGQTELRRTLQSNSADVREIAQRCELVELEALDNDLDAYLRHKSGRMGLKFEDVFAQDAVDAIRARLTWRPRGTPGQAPQAQSVCFPLAVANLVTRAMNAAASVGWAKVDAECIKSC